MEFVAWLATLWLPYVLFFVGGKREVDSSSAVSVILPGGGAVLCYVFARGATCLVARYICGKVQLHFYSNIIAGLENAAVCCLQCNMFRWYMQCQFAYL